MKPYEILAVAQPGLEETAAEEIRGLGYSDLTLLKGGILLKGHQSTLMKLNLACRCLSRVLIRAGQFEATSFSLLEKRFAELPWQDFLNTQNICIRVSSWQSALYHEKAISQRLVESLSKLLGRAVTAVGSPDEEDAQLIVLHVRHDVFTVRMDSSGAHLHKRGYGVYKEEAPLRETVACALLYAAGWPGSAPALCDPLCGSGTIPIEAALMARKVPHCAFRSFAFERWNCFQPEVYERVRTELLGQVASQPRARIFASDLDPGAVDSARRNADQAGVTGLVGFAAADFSEIEIDRNAIIVTNPPWGKRLESGLDSRAKAKLMGLFQRGQAVHLLLPEPQAAGFPFPHQTLLSFELGGIKVRFIRLEGHK